MFESKARLIPLYNLKIPKLEKVDFEIANRYINYNNTAINNNLTLFLNN